ncbi:MAG: 3-phosphoshikimate 1-carboxyvinyltransferase [Planctomycetota bacterium]
MSESIVIHPPAEPVRGRIRPPGSKSITNRALVCAALAQGRSELSGALDSEDTNVMIDALGGVGIGVERFDEGERLAVTGCGGSVPPAAGDLFVANSGTTMRFLTAMLTLGQSRYRIDGIPRMRERPIADLLEALKQLGAHVSSESGNGCPPVVIEGDGLRGGEAAIRGDISSQFLSGLMMAAPCAQAPVVLRVEGALVSVPYVEMTARVMESFGAEVEQSDDYGRIGIAAPGGYRATKYAIEPDASAASYFLAAAAITGGEVTVEGLGAGSLQGDVRFAECLGAMGCQVEIGSDAITVAGGELRGIDVDMNDISDTVQTLAAVALFAEGPTTVRNVAHIRHKETDRIQAVVDELRKLGAGAEATEDGMVITPGEPRAAAIATYNDHRMAMSFALAGLRIPRVEILDPGCTVKTYPGYFDDLRRLSGFR